MGWCSGTEYFDLAVDVALRHAPVRNTDDGAQVLPKIRKAIIAEVYKGFDYSDWDCQSESKYFESDLVHHMHDIGEIDDEDYRCYTEPDYDPDYD